MHGGNSGKFCNLKKKKNIIWLYYPSFKLLPEAIAERFYVRGVISQLATLGHKQILIPQRIAEFSKFLRNMFILLNFGLTAV